MIRLAGPDDAATVAALLAAFRDWWGSTTPSDETFRRTAARLLDDPQTEFLLAGEGGLAQLRYRLSAWPASRTAGSRTSTCATPRAAAGSGRDAAAGGCARVRGCRRIELDVN